MKALIIGLVVGGAMAVAAERLIFHRSPESEPLPPPSAQANGSTPPRATQIPAPSRLPTEEVRRSETTLASPTRSHESGGVSEPMSAAIDTTAIARQYIATLSDRELSELWAERHNEKERRAQAARDAEPKDAAWAYSMEQLLGQHLARTLSPHQIEHIKIDCRTSFCEIAWRGKSEEDFLEFQRESNEVAQEPWAKLSYPGSSSGSDGINWHALVRYYREGYLPIEP